METREAAMKALEDGKKLTNRISGTQYMLIDGKLHRKCNNLSEWEPSDLSFFNPPSWLNLEI